MSTQQELLNAYERYFGFIRNQLINGNYAEAIQSAELFANYLKVKVDELGERDGEV